MLVDLFAIGWLRPVAALGRRRDRMHTAAELRGMLADARLTLVGWRPVFGLGRLPLVSAAVAHSGRQAGGGPRTAQGRRSLGGAGAVWVSSWRECAAASRPAILRS